MRYLRSAAAVQVFESFETRIVLADQHLEFIDVVRNRRAESFGPRFLPFVSVEHDVEIAALEQVGQFLPLALRESCGHTQFAGQQVRQFHFKTLDLRRILVRG